MDEGSFDPFDHLNNVQRVLGEELEELMGALKYQLPKVSPGFSQTFDDQGRSNPDAAVVGSQIPTLHASYARLLHPVAISDGAGSSRLVRWSELLGRSYLEQHPAASFAQLNSERKGATPPQDVEPLVGELDVPTAQYLSQGLAKHVDSASLTYYLFWGGLGLLGVGKDLVYRGPLSAVDRFGSAGGDDYTSPTAWWDSNNRWFVTTHTDATSTYIGGPEQLVADIVASVDLDVVSVAGDARVDDYHATRREA